MTDNEIIKAWEKVLNNSDEPIGEHWMVFVTTQMAKETFDMLTRQKAEIERLRYILVNFMGEIFDWGNKNGVDTRIFAQTAILGKEKDGAVKQIKSEAYREFAEKVKTKKFTHKNFGELVYVEDIDTTLNKLLSNDIGRYDHYTDSFVKEPAESNE